MEGYFWVAVIAFGLKLYLWFSSKDYSWVDSRCLLLMTAFSIQNISECLAYQFFDEVLSPTMFIHLYYASLISVMWCIYNFILNKESRWQQAVLHCFAVTGVLLCVGIIFSNEIVGEYEASTVPIRAIKGVFFPVFLAYVAIGITVTIWTLIYNYCYTLEPTERINYLCCIFSFSPFIIVVSILSVGMILGLNVNGSGVLPIASSMFLAIMIKTKCHSSSNVRHDPRCYIPFTKEKRLVDQAITAATHSSANRLGLESSIETLEKAIIRYHLDDCKGNKTKLAGALGISRQKLYRKLEKYGWHESN